MYRLTQIRLGKARHILEKYRDQLHRHSHFDAGQFEMELRKCWNLGYKELKSIAEDMLKNARYKCVALYYMEHSNAPGAVVEFQPLLSKGEFRGRNTQQHDPAQRVRTGRRKRRQDLPVPGHDGEF